MFFVSFQTCLFLATVFADFGYFWLCFCDIWLKGFLKCGKTGLFCNLYSRQYTLDSVVAVPAAVMQNNIASSFLLHL